MKAKRYIEWNRALWMYFFGDPQHPNTILYVDENVLKSVANQAGMALVDGVTLEEDFLSCTFVNVDNNFRREWMECTGGTWGTFGDGWIPFVNFVIKEKIADIPAYFAIICAIMYAACKYDKITHPKINEIASKYSTQVFGGRSANCPGSYIESLFTQLHKDMPEFNADRMVRGTQRFVSRIKFHQVLRGDERKELINFLEVNNLKWEYDSFVDYANNILIPALHRANKTDIIKKVTNPDYITYFKNLVTSGLNFGRKPKDGENAPQPLDIPWRYEIDFDNDDNPHFYVAFGVDFPFNVFIKDGKFTIGDDAENSEYIQLNQFVQIQPSEVEYNGKEYVFKNIADKMDEIYFEQIDLDIYHQVKNCENHESSYFKLIKRNISNNHKIEECVPFNRNLSIEDYEAWGITNNVVRPAKGKKLDKQLTDRHCLEGFGTWYAVNLFENEELYWQPQERVSKELIKISPRFVSCGRTYFRIPRSSANSNFLRGNLLFQNKHTHDFEDSEQIVDDFKWDGTTQLYHLNGWGEAVTEENMDYNEGKITGSYTLPCNCHQPTEGAGMLVQILFDIADVHGCIPQRYIVKALDFALKAKGITPDRYNRSSLIYALRRLGYLISFYNPDNKEYQNQVVPAYLEKTNYNFYVDAGGRAYLVRGIYSEESLRILLAGTAPQSVNYKRPYNRGEENSHPEYKCLPDLILTNTQESENWRVQNYPSANIFVSLMKGMEHFEEDFFNNDGDEDQHYPHHEVPYMRIDDYNKNKEVLITGGNDGQYMIRKYYRNVEGKQIPIPTQLARLYCQNMHQQPVCLMGTETAEGRVSLDLSKLTLLSGMGSSFLLDMALCDLNLGLPDFRYAFVVDKSTSSLPSKNTITGSWTYATNANTNHDSLLKEMVGKLCGYRIDDLGTCPPVFVKARERMKMNFDIAHHSLFLKEINNGPVVAFSSHHKVYANFSGDCFYQVEGDNVNQILSNIYNGGKVQLTERVYDGDVPIPDDKTLLLEVNIINPKK